MQVQFELVIGENKFTLTETISNNSEFFEKLSFYSTLPKVGPNGETDLVVSHRVAQGKYAYYSIVSKKAGLEYKFGQSKKNDGSLFGKGWEPIYNGNEDNDEEAEQAVMPGQSIGLGSTASARAATKPAAAKPAAGLGATTAQARPAQAAAQAPATAAPASNNAPLTDVQKQAKNVLAKFGV